MNEMTNETNNVGTNVKAIISFILGLTTLFWMIVFPIIGVILGTTGLILGILAMKDIKRTKQSGKWLAIVGVVCGVLGIVMMLLTIGLGTYFYLNIAAYSVM